MTAQARMLNDLVQILMDDAGMPEKWAKQSAYEVVYCGKTLEEAVEGSPYYAEVNGHIIPKVS